MREIEIGYATEADLDTMADLLAALFTLESDFTPDRAKQLAGLRLILAQPVLGRLFVLRVQGRVVGMANALITVSTAEGGRVVLLEDVIIHPDYRRLGLGRQLLQHILAWAATEGMTRVTLLADKNNTPALNFYARLGFQPSAMTALRARVQDPASAKPGRSG